MNTMYEKPSIELIYYKPLENIMDQDGNPSITDGVEDWGNDNN